MLPSCKSSPLIEEGARPQRSSNSSKRSSRQRDSNEYEYRKVPNPFLACGQENLVPAGLLKEVGQLDFITPHHLHKLPWEQVAAVPRRSSVFARQLQVMQRAVKEQEEKSRGALGKKGRVQFVEEEEEEQGSLSMDEERLDASLGVANWPDLEEEGMDEEPPEEVFAQVLFYSYNQLPHPVLEVDDYF